MFNKTLNEVLADLGYVAEPTGKPGEKMILTQRRKVEEFRGRAHEVWAWVKKCPLCNFRGHIEDDCRCCEGSGVRPYFADAGQGERGAA